jgi:hypothetical protein
LSIQSISFADTDYHAGFAMAETDAGFALCSFFISARAV